MNDLLEELNSLTPEVLDQNELRAGRRKAPWVKVYNEFEADTTFSEGVGRDGKRLLVLKWTNMRILDSDTPWTGTEDEDEFPFSDRANSKMGFLIKSAATHGASPVTKLNEHRVHYKLGLWQQKNADGTVRLNDKGFPAYELWYWEVIGVGAGNVNGAKPALSNEDFEAKLPLVVGQTHASAIQLAGAEVVSKGLLSKRISQVDGVYQLVSA